MRLQFHTRMVDTLVRPPMTSESEAHLTRFFHLPSAHDKSVVAPYFIVFDDLIRRIMP